MYNDLIFPILPRNSKIPVEGDNRIQRIRKIAKSDPLNQDEKAPRYEVHGADEAELVEHHKRVNMIYGDANKGRNTSDQYDQRRTVNTSASTPSSKDDSGKTTQTKETRAAGRKHLDVYI